MIDPASTAAVAKTIKILSDMITTWRKNKSTPPSEKEFGELLSHWVSFLSYTNDASATILQQKTIIDDLLKKVKDQEDWDNEKERYQLTEVNRGMFVYRLRDSERMVDEPTHWLCQHCADRGRKSVIQLARSSAAGHEFICPGCKHPFFISSRLKKEDESYSPPGSSDPDSWMNI